MISSKLNNFRFEKSLYDLIRGLRNHRGKEAVYIQSSLRECRAEIKSQDMDVKATALLKLVYLEMFGHDMSWASFNVLEVMSSPKHLQKRVGYLAAVQSFRSDTEVLMLATNLLKKDLTSSLPATLSLPLVTLPHVINPALAMSLTEDLLPRLTHSHAAIRKKTIVTLYRFALVYPETLRAAWPRIKERLMDENEDSSVTSATVNVVCELGWRRPQDFLPLAPRLFSLLVEGGNNWMAIKIIKLFATLTPLEPRLVRKLLPPLTSLIRTTPAMSLLYECINGIIQGGILGNTESTAEGEEIARLCVGKLRGMIAMEGDPNLKYVALLAFQKMVHDHQYLVSLHQDVILSCLDDADISIRLRALDLLVNMVDSDNMMAIVGKLMRQLHQSPVASNADDPVHDRSSHGDIVPAADSDEEDPEESLRPAEQKSAQPPPLPEDYRMAVTKRILEMCSRETYANVSDFVWYIDVMVQLVALAPVPTTAGDSSFNDLPDEPRYTDVSRDIGLELLNVAVRVRDVRPEATRAAERLINDRRRSSSIKNDGFLSSAVWVIGEYATYLNDAQDTLSTLLQPSTLLLPADILTVYLQAIPKVFLSISRAEYGEWTPERRSMTCMLVDSIVHFLDTLTNHPHLEVQERAVELVELMRLVADSLSAQQDGHHEGVASTAAPLVISQVVPSLFTGMDLNPVAPAAQRKVPIPEGLDLDTPINDSLPELLQSSAVMLVDDSDTDESAIFYHRRPKQLNTSAEVVPAAKLLDQAQADAPSYQQLTPYDDAEANARRRAERREKNKDDPFYIPTTTDGDSGTGTPMGDIIRQSNNGEEVDLDSIPIMDLSIEIRDRASAAGRSSPQGIPHAAVPPTALGRKRVDIISDETIHFDNEISSSRPSSLGKSFEDYRPGRSRAKKALLQVDSSGLGSLSLDDDNNNHNSSGDGFQRYQQREHGGGGSGADQDEEVDEEMLRALREVENRRLEIQRAAERVQVAKGVSEEGGTLIRKKVKKKKKKKVRKESEGEVEETIGAGEGEGEGEGGIQQQIE